MKSLTIAIIIGVAEAIAVSATIPSSEGCTPFMFAFAPLLIAFFNEAKSPPNLVQNFLCQHLLKHMVWRLLICI